MCACHEVTVCVCVSLRRFAALDFQIKVPHKQLFPRIKLVPTHTVIIIQCVWGIHINTFAMEANKNGNDIRFFRINSSIFFFAMLRFYHVLMIIAIIATTTTINRYHRSKHRTVSGLNPDICEKTDFLLSVLALFSITHRVFSKFHFSYTLSFLSSFNLPSFRSG